MEPGELIALQLVLARDSSDGEAAGRAERALRALNPVLLARFAAEDADDGELAWLVGNVEEPQVSEAVIARRSTPTVLLERLAPGLAPALQEALLLRQDRIVEHPAILDRLAANPRLSLFARRRIAEYREHLLGGERESRPPDEEDEATELEAAAAIVAARAMPAAGDVEETTGLSEGQVRALPPRVRIRLARRANAAMRQLLLRDPHPRVALAVLQGSLSDGEVEQIARSRSVVEDVLEAIAKRREWSRKYSIVLALCGNPRLPVGAAVRLLPQLGVRDLRNLGRDRNVADAVRAQAMRLYMIKSK